MRRKILEDRKELIPHILHLKPDTSVEELALLLKMAPSTVYNIRDIQRSMAVLLGARARKGAVGISKLCFAVETLGGWGAVTALALYFASASSRLCFRKYDAVQQSPKLGWLVVWLRRKGLESWTLVLQLDKTARES